MRFRTLAALALSTLLLPPANAATSPEELLAAGRVDETIQTLEQKTTGASPDAKAHNLLCRAYFMIDEWDRGIPACERARNLDPLNSLYHLWLGRIYGEKADRVGFFSAAGLARKVRVEFERAVELDPWNVEARVDLAEFYFSAPGIVGGGKDKARSQAEAMAVFNPAVAHYVSGRIAESEKNSMAAEREFRAAIEASHGTAHAWLHLAQFLAHANRLDEMQQALRSMESSPVDRPEALMDGASLLLRTGRDYSMALRLLRRYLSNGPVEGGPAFKAHDLLGQLLEKQGDPRAATDEYRAALALSHNYARAQEHLKRVEH